ncbi:hypothetical protein SAMN05660826_00996 [Caldanaerovirga acetigignens]|uniref:CARDB domain-containing protein n=1 Tax=Caldanaerovirga acetigignens TaxID=447595 RepID=A0A1M7IQI3_9FIRM|nr:hypothetical protein [Caldanaerovirga acetigignens]SHM42990.1 hypothetical protein SAMN05660826_00996 [Caldanaerovirga acetigignens]
MTVDEYISKLEELGDKVEIDEGLSMFDKKIELGELIILKMLLNKKFGLKEIKKEIREIEKKLDDPEAGLEEIKKEIREIECKLDSPKFGLAEIKEEIKDIEEKLDNPDSGLAEIKREIKEIEEKLDNPDTGLEEIKKEIQDIECKLDSPEFGLAEIKEEIKDIEGKLDSPEFGLEEIKREIKEIEEKLDRIIPPITNVLTTGPVVADSGANSIIAKVLNNSDETVNVTVNLYNIGTCPDPKELLESVELTIESKCAKAVVLQKPETEWEVQYVGIKPEVFVFTAARTNGSEAPISASNLLPANTFRHSEHVPTTDP